jgi:ABC-type Mn2+/Zn2+ transport system ATPase subunit
MSPVESVLFGMNVQCDHLAYTALKMASMHKAETFIAASGGELQRIMIARVLYLAMTENRKNIILDEPDNNIDAATFRKIMVRIHKYAERSNSKVLFTTHKIHALSGIDYTATTIKQLKDKMD